MLGDYIRIACPQCKSVLEIPVGHDEQITICPYCGNTEGFPAQEPSIATDCEQQKVNVDKPKPAALDADGGKTYVPDDDSSASQWGSFKNLEVTSPKWSPGKGIFLGVFLLLLFAILSVCSTDENGDQNAQEPVSSHVSANPKTAMSPWIMACGNLWTGVKLYYGPDKAYVGEVLGGNEKYVDPYTGEKFRGIKILMRSGSIEWKDRKAVMFWYVRSDDPAISAMRWAEYQF